jgi:hypothetical protein
MESRWEIGRVEGGYRVGRAGEGTADGKKGPRKKS